MTTFRNEPIASPKTAAATMNCESESTIGTGPLQRPARGAT